MSKPWNFLFWNKVYTYTISNCFKLTFPKNCLFYILCWILYGYATFQKFDFVVSASENFHTEAYFFHFCNLCTNPYFLQNTLSKMLEWKGSKQVIFNSQIYILRLFQPTLLLLSSKKVVPWLLLCRFLFENGWAMTRTGHSILSLTSKHELPTHAFFSADLLGPAYANIDIVQKKPYTPLECCL